MWGKPPVIIALRRFIRNIPTRVGKTSTPWPAPWGRTEHPHACGENVSWCPCVFCGVGTSPRVWGKHVCACLSTPSPRNIPTRVGKTVGSSPRRCGRAEHPHACGENSTLNGGHNPFNGTSPRVWGKLFDLPRSGFGSRNIPTRVGKTDCAYCGTPMTSEHPHACGENPSEMNAQQADHGTSPRVWGKLDAV